ncbi:MAG TPA: hypothetical protein VL284_01135 [Thermoanaerobaculia bacterium]|nr:hypothetical protein [Thermoanaerobaculia bacterium]
MPVEILRVESRRAARQRRMQKVQHLFAAALLITTAMQHGLRSPLAIAEIAAGALLIAAFVRERLRHGHHGGVAWVEIAGAAMTLVEAVERTRGRHHLSFVVLSFLAPAVLLVFAIFDARIAEARYLKADEDGFEVRLRLFFRRRVRWKEIRGFRATSDAIELEGARNISLRGIVDREAAVQWSVEQFRKRGVPELEDTADQEQRRIGEAGDR